MKSAQKYSKGGGAVWQAPLAWPGRRPGFGRLKSLPKSLSDMRRRPPEKRFSLKCRIINCFKSALSVL